MTKFSIRVDDTEVTVGIQKLKGAFPENMEGAGMEAANEVLDTVGVRTYPPASPANFPPEPFYIRGRGTQTKSGNRGESQQYGKRWQITAEGFQTIAENFATYGAFLVTEFQPIHMARIGWRKLGDVVEEKIERIIEIYEKWAQKGIDEAGLG